MSQADDFSAFSKKNWRMTVEAAKPGTLQKVKYVAVPLEVVLPDPPYVTRLGNRTRGTDERGSAP